MKKYFQHFFDLLKNKYYMWVLVLTAVCSYGFVVTHHTIGIDDTPFEYYFEEGLAAIVGRWVMFLVNKVVQVSQFAPFITDFAGVLILMAAVTVWAVLFRSVAEENRSGEEMKKLPDYGYWFFAAIFLSCPLISEVFTYYLHNGIAIGYLSCGVSLCCMREGFLALDRQTGRRILPGWQAVKCFLGGLLGLWIGMGCYESFMIVWIQGLCFLLLWERLTGGRRNVFGALCTGAVTAVLGIVLRSLMVRLVTAVFGLGYLETAAEHRGIGELVSWLFEEGAMSELAMVLKRMFVMYGVFAYAYLPIRIFMLALVVMGVYCLWRTVKERDAWLLLLMLGGAAVPLLLAVIECKATYYRSAQFLPLVCGFGMLLAVYWMERIKNRLCRRSTPGNKPVLWQARVAKLLEGGVIFVLCVILWNQCADMNKWFYVDYMKYESAKDLAGRIYNELEQNHDISKPVVFTGSYEVPRSIIKDAYVLIGSETFFKIKRITDGVDEHLLEKFYRGNGVWVAQTPALSVIDWARNAFDGGEEMETFFEMHGYELRALEDYALYKEAELYSVELPEFPEVGSIVDMGAYIIVHL